MEYKCPRIKSIYPVYKLSDHVFRIGAQIGLTKEFRDPTNQLWTLAQSLDGRSLENVLSSVRLSFPELTDDYILDGIRLLDKEGFIEETLPNEITDFNDRYIPNINYFSRFVGVDGDRYSIQKKINDSTILLLGLGGGGSNVLNLLGGLGPKKIIIVDYDRVEEENLGRQMMYHESDIGKLKIDVAAENIHAINSKIKIETHNRKIVSSNDVLRYTKGVDLVFSAIDEPQFLINRIVNKAIVEANVPCVFGLTQISRGRVFSVIPGKSGCFDCMAIYYTLKDDDFIKQFKGLGKSNYHPGQIAYAPAMYQLTAAMVDEGVRILTGYAEPRSIATQYELNFENGSSFKHKSWPRYVECPTCGTGKESDWEVFGDFKFFEK